MRVTVPGIHRTSERVAITFDGETIEAYPGEVVGAALTAAGHLSLRRTRRGDARGLFCGMGVCSECLVRIDGEPNRRACMTPVRAGMAIERQQDPIASPGPRAAQSRETELRPDILVIGGGPAGLSAALAAAESGAKTLLVDERVSLGGQFFKPLAASHRFAGDRPRDRQFAAGRALVRAVEATGVEIMRGAEVWGAFAPDEVTLLGGGTDYVARPRRLILAPGAYERGVPVPGWTLPGFMTTGAAQTLLRAYRVAPGQRILVAGNGPLNLQVAAELLRAGVEVVGLVEAARSPAARPGALLAAFIRAPDLIRDGLGYMARLLLAGVPLFHRHAVLRAEGEGRIESVTIGRIDEAGRPVRGTERSFAVDAVLAGYGFQPSAEIARMLGCRHRFDPGRRTLVVERDADGRTSQGDVFVAGDGGGLGGSRVAMAQGFLAGIAAASDLGLEAGAVLTRAADGHRRARRRHLAFQEALWRLYEAPRLSLQLATDDNTIVCRCEEVTLGQIRAAFDDGTHAIGSAKRATRAGMGRCQGRYCASLLAELSSAASGVSLDEFAFFAPRMPVKPVAIASLARAVQKTPGTLSMPSQRER
jgi:NADPH-dependent 2,4-dienoyl-CoA reductase/sulfur reductase-like enzyme